MRCITIVPLLEVLRELLFAGADAGSDVTLAETETFESSAATLAVSAGISIAPQNSATPKTHISVLLQRNEMVSDVVIIFIAFQMSKIMISSYALIRASAVPIFFGQNLYGIIKAI